MTTSNTITKTDLENILNEVLPFSYNDDLAKTESFGLPAITIAAGGTYTNTDLDVSSHIPNGYKLIDVECRATGGNEIYCYQVGKATDTTAVLQLKNTKSASVTVTPMLKTICINQLYASVGKTQADYIVEQGTSGDWTYRKWNSGLYECFCERSDSFAMTNQLGNTYYGNVTVTISSLGFVSIKNVQITGGGGGHYFGAKVDTGGVTTTSFVISARASGSQTATLTHWVYIIGTWK